jgi:formamidopyrimidine-DNA glycosylase
MPELAEVEHGRRLAESVAVGRRITRARCADDRIVFDGVAPSTVAKKLRGRGVLAVRRWGKQLWFELDSAPHPLFHFGMTGAFRIPTAEPLALESGIRDDGNWPPRFTKIHLFFDDGGEMVMTNARRLGRIRLRRDPMREPPISQLGFDPLLALPSPREFSTLLGERNRPIKNVLMDQGFSAGVGNWIADEVLYQAGVDPRRRASDLTGPERRAIRTALRRVVRKAVEVNARKERLPRTWLFHHRWGKAEGAMTSRGEPIEFMQLGGRTTAFVPSRQR